MKKQVNHTIRKHFNELIYNVARYTEILLSVIIFLVIVKASLPLMDELLHMPMRETDMNYYSHFLSNALALVVGVEFVKMLCRHTAETVVEVLLFATARQMVVEHLGPVETLVGVLAIGILFAIRKYLLGKDEKLTNVERDTKI